MPSPLASSQHSHEVVVRREPLVLPTYEPMPPDKNPMFLEKRVYQGSSGRVYPLPFYNRISEVKRDRAWDSVTIENQWIKVVILPELGGRIFAGQDKTNGYDFFYRNNVIKPALVALAGPWISGGVEFNWPQHHRPATFMPVDVEIEEHDDGSKTVWLGDHDPMERMKGMHGVCLHPDRAMIEVKMRAFNRTPHVKTFHWWANVATHVHEAYKAIFPEDVDYVADHARRAMSRFPLCEGRYYGVDYAARARHGVPAAEVPPQFTPPHARPEKHIPGVPDYSPADLTWYANIPVPTSYMCLGSEQDFSGGYDYYKQAGVIQVANHHIAPGKKMWTWGNHPFGYAWDRNLTDADGPYIELMLGVFTDNQPDFTFLQPGETKAWSVYWYPVQKIGAACAANANAAASLALEKNTANIGVAVTQPRSLRVELWRGAKRLRDWSADAAPDRPFLASAKLPAGCAAKELSLVVTSADGSELLRYVPRGDAKKKMPPPASEPPAPADIAGADELYITGLHLSQYRHATRSPVPYWQEALRRDPGDSRCNTALGTWHLKRGEFLEAEDYLRTAIERQTRRNPNPADGEAFYQLGLALRFQNRDEEAHAAFYKATWNQAWQPAAFHALAEIDAAKKDWAASLEHLDCALRLNTDNLRARNLRALVLRQLGRDADAQHSLRETLKLDPLDWWARHLAGDAIRCDNHTRLDIAIDFASAGFFDEAVRLLENAVPEASSGATPMIHYHMAAWLEKTGRKKDALAAAKRAAAAAPDYCFPARLEDIAILRRALERDPRDARAAYYLGNLFYDRRRYAEAIALWEKSARIAPDFSIVWRNLGIAYFNVQNAPAKARRAYEQAIKANPSDARLIHERDQLWKRLGLSANARLRELERHRNLVAERDDATIELCALYNQTGQPARALEILRSRKFQPWEGGEGQALGSHVRTHLALGKAALRAGDAEGAIAEFSAALNPPENLSETRHLLANQSDVWFWLGEAHAAAGRDRDAKTWWRRAAGARGDFQEMSVKTYSEMTYFSARALERLGKRAAAKTLFSELAAHARDLAKQPAKIDYFATSLPTMLLFDDDLTARQKTAALFLQAQAALGLGRPAAAKKLLAEVLCRDPSHAAASDLKTEL